jgi:hypothetical protein
MNMAPLASSGFDEPLAVEQRLTQAEDDDLRRLHWLSQMGTLSSCKRLCLMDLLVRDRRAQIRAPREFLPPR